MPGERAFKAMGELKAPIGPNTAHLCIDMQRLFSDEGPWPMAWMPRVTPKVEQLVARAPERTIFTRFIPPKKPEDAPGRWRVYYEKWSHVTRRHLDHPYRSPARSHSICAASNSIGQGCLFGLRQPASPSASSRTPDRYAHHFRVGDRCVRAVLNSCCGRLWLPDHRC
jgi:hypothetical protein